MIDEVQKDETTAETVVEKVEAEAVTLWHEVEAFFAKLKARVEGDENKVQVLTTFQAATHEVVGSEAPSNETPAPQADEAPAVGNAPAEDGNDDGVAVEPSPATGESVMSADTATTTTTEA